MFGLLQPCRHQLDDELLEQWRSHLCGLCLSLRDHHGQVTRLTVNNDAVMTSVLLRAQRPSAPRLTAAGPCLLRGLRSATVIASAEVPARFAATTTLTLAAAKSADMAAEHAAGVTSARPARAALAAGAARSLARRAAGDAPMSAAVDSPAMLDMLSGQAAVEARVQPGDSLLAVTAASAAAAGTVFAATAALAGTPQNAPELRAIGEAFGRLAHLLDAVEDLERDARSGSFNPLAATGSDRQQVKALCRRLSGRIAHGVHRLELVDGRLLTVLLTDVVHAAVHRVFDGSPGTPLEAPDARGRKFWRNVAPWAGVYCTGYALCAEHANPCTGRRHPAGCDGCDGCDGCCDCCDCSC